MTKHILCVRVPLFRGLSEPINGLLIILIFPFTKIYATNVELRLGEAFFRGRLDVVKSFFFVTKNAISIYVTPPQLILRCDVTFGSHFFMIIKCFNLLGTHPC